MKQGCVWFLLSCKRYLRRVSFLLILLVLPAAAFFIRRLEREEGQEVKIAVCAEGVSRKEEGTTSIENPDRSLTPLEEELLEALTGEEEGRNRALFRFYACEDEEQVKAQVASRKAECGYVISRDLRRKLDEKDYKRCIRVYSAPSTVLAALSTETVFASLMKLYDREIFVDYAVESVTVREEETADGSGVPGGGELAGGSEKKLEKLAGELYDKWLNNGSTFRFEYRWQKQKHEKTDGETGREDSSYEGNGIEPVDQTEEEPLMVFPVRGIVAVFLLLTGLYSAVMLGNDEKKGLFLPLSPGQRLVCRIGVLGAPVFLGALSAFGALKAGGCLQDPVREAWVMAVYVLAVCVFSWGVKAVCRRPQAVCCLIPFFLVGSLVFTPVFVDMRQFFPAWGWIEKLFLPSYYLRAF